VGDPNNDVDVASGACRSDDNMEDILLAGTLTKQLDAVWSQGTNLGGLDTGAKAADTFYHVYAIKNPSTDVVDVLLSTSMTPTMPSGFTLKRRLGSVRTDGSSNLLAFSQESDEFLWAAPTLDATNLTVNATAALQAVKVPSGVKVFAILTSVWQGNAAAGLGIISSPDVNDVAPSLTAAPLLTHRTVDATPAGWSTLRVRTNTSAQVRLRGGIATQHLWLCTLGWLDSRGRDA
jgi:hypothetical protein